MFELGFFGQRDNQSYSFEPEPGNLDTQEIFCPNEDNVLAIGALAVAIIASENAVAGDIIPVPLPNTESMPNATSLRTEIATSRTSGHPLLVDVVEKEGETIALFQCV